MGIQFSHCDASWSYGGFDRFRHHLAEQIGIDLDKMQGFNHRRIGVIPWDQVNDPIVPLLNHSDCDGTLSAKDCRTVAPRLRQLVNDWPVDDYDRVMALSLAEGMERAAKARQKLRFL